MGVSVRLSRNTRVYLPFWIAIPAWLIVGAAWIVILAVLAVVWLLVILPVRGGKALARSRAQRRSAQTSGAARGVRAGMERPGSGGRAGDL